MSEDAKDEIRDLYFRLSRKNVADPREYTMTEIGKIAERAMEIIKKHNGSSGSLPILNEVEEKSTTFHRGQTYMVPANIIEVKNLATKGFEEFFGEEPGIDL